MACEDSGLIARLKRGVSAEHANHCDLLIVVGDRTGAPVATTLALEPACPQAGQDVGEDVWRRAG
jgi:hypothetical protein